MASEWFDSVTGSNDHQRQSWRDSYNGGRAAGDWTGNNNARLDSERDRFQGATYSGSSTQMSAIQLAQAIGKTVARPTASTGPGVAHVVKKPDAGRPVANAPITGPGVGGIAPSPTPGPGGGGMVTPKPRGGSLQLGGGPGNPGAGPLRPNLEPEVTQVMIGGDWWEPNPWFSDADQFTQRYGEGELAETAFFVTTLGADIVWNSGRLGSVVIGPTIDRFSRELEQAAGLTEPMAPMGRPASLNW